MTLPSPPTRALLRGFCMAAGLLFSGLLALVVGIANPPGWPLWVIGGFLLLAGLGLLAPELARKPYDLWNRGADVFRRAARLALSATCFAIVTVAGRGGSRLRWGSAHGTESGWMVRPASSFPDYFGTFGASGATESQQGWLRPLLGWTLRTRNAWAWSLLPCLLLLRVLRTEHEGSLDDRIYTLF